MCIAKRWVKLSYVDNFFDEGSVLNFLFVVVFFFDFVYYVGDDFDADYKEINKWFCVAEMHYDRDKALCDKNLHIPLGRLSSSSSS